MRFRILGPLEVLSPEGWTAISAAKWRSLLACLLVRPGQLISTETLIDELWGDSPPGTANNLVSIYVHRLRKVIGDAEGKTLVYRAPGYLLRVSPGDLDLHDFESLTAEGRAALARHEPDRAADLLAEALGLWRGPLLADVPPSSLITTQVSQSVEQWLEAVELRIGADLACGRAAQVVPELRGLVAEYPLREGLWALLMRALDAAGRHAEALGTYFQAKEVLAEDLGVDPGAELQQLYLDLLAADATTASSAVPQTRPGPVPSDTADAGPPPGGALPGPPRTPSHPGAEGDSAGRPRTEPATPPSSTDMPGSIAIGTFADLLPAADTEPTAQAAPAPVPLAARPTQLPADIGDFTGRETHVAHLSGMLLAEKATGSPGAVPIAVVNGAAGLGKTTLAVHAAHQVSARFPDGQLYVDLLGASAQPADPGEVLARFLRDLGVEGDKVPARDDERAALYRTRLTGRRVLILLDNAKDAAQVRPLLPGSSSCAVLVTTRNRTPDLVSTRFVDLNVLEDTDALALFARIVGEERAAAEPDATAEVLVACAGLPLAIRICAARLAARRQWQVATLAKRLRDEHRRLDEMRIGDLAVRASFQVSYDSLKSGGRGVSPAQVFRLLGLWQGTSISLAAAAALIGEDEDDIADALETLVDATLLESPAPDRYRFHDLLRFFATERAQAEDSEAARAEAVDRLLRWYLESAEAAADTISPQRYRVPRDPGPDGYPALDFDGVEQVMAWYDDERANLLAATRQAAATGLREIAWRLPCTLFPLFTRKSNWADCLTATRVAAESADKDGDRRGEAWAQYQLGWALVRLVDQEAAVHLEQALAIRRELGDAVGQAQAAIGLGEVQLRLHGPSDAAAAYLRQAVDLLRSTTAASMRAAALNNLGEVYVGLGDLSEAMECYRESRDISREMGGGHVEGYALDGLGLVYLRLHRLDESVASLKEALDKHRATGMLVGEAVALRHLGEAQWELGAVAEARASFLWALRIFEQIGDRPKADETAGLLASLTAGGSQSA
jgi:DNA-binding SARP family transcriptional activator/tetratricopeptide (TPR) repeat protein